MEHNELDDLFRKSIQGDDSDLNEKELASKKNIWETLEPPRKKRIFPFWKVAAAVLFLMLGGMSWFFSKKINQQQNDFTQLEERYNNIKTSLDFAQNALRNKSTTIAQQKVNVLPKEKKKDVHVIEKKEYVDRVVFVSDTVFLEKNNNPEEKIKLVRDTIYIEVPVKAPSKMVELEIPNEGLEETVKRKKKPSKVEFVFDKKALEKPKQKRRYFNVKDTDVASKKKKRKPIIPINNQ